MAIELFFVPELSGDRRQKELIYSECKAHTSRRAHGERRRLQHGNHHVSVPTVDDADLGSVRLPRQSSGRAGSMQVCLNHAQSHCLGSMLRSSDMAVHEQLAPIVQFAKLHLKRSASPMWLDFRGRSMMLSPNTTNTPCNLDVSAWLWKNWTSKTDLFWTVLASVIPLMARFSDDHARGSLNYRAMVMKGRGMQILQLKLNGNVLPISERVTIAYQIKALFRGACATGDTVAARCHARMLSTLVEDMFLEPVLRNVRWQLAMWGDALPALLQTRLPVVPYTQWMPKTIRELWKAAETTTCLYDFVPDFYEIPNVISSKVLRDALVYLKRTASISRYLHVMQNVANTDQSELIFKWMLTKAEHHMCLLLTEQQSFQTTEQDLITHEMYLESALRLTTLYLYQKMFFELLLDDGSDIHESAHVVVPRIKWSLVEAQRMSSNHEWQSSRAARFWILAVCACATDNSFQKTFSSLTSADLSWLRAQLAITASELDINDDASARRILHQYFWHETKLILPRNLLTL